jgi:hypothetical protein
MKSANENSGEPVHEGLADMFHNYGNAEFPNVPVAKI